jgi:hypothetical protein
MIQIIPQTPQTDRKLRQAKQKGERINTPNTTHPAIYSSLQSASNSKKRKIGWIEAPQASSLSQANSAREDP